MTQLYKDGRPVFEDKEDVTHCNISWKNVFILSTVFYLMGLLYFSALDYIMPLINESSTFISVSGFFMMWMLTLLSAYALVKLLPKIKIIQECKNKNESDDVNVKNEVTK